MKSRQEILIKLQELSNYRDQYFKHAIDSKNSDELKACEVFMEKAILQMNILYWVLGD